MPRFAAPLFALATLLSASCGLGAPEPPPEPRRAKAHKTEQPEPARRARERKAKAPERAARDTDQERRPRARPRAGDEAVTDALEAIGYLQGVEEATDQAGVTRHDPTRAQPGTNLLVSGHAWQAELVSMDGEVLHTWTMPKQARKGLKDDWWRRAWVIDDGHLLAIVEGESLVRVDRDSNLVWQVRHQNHHDVHLNDDGTLWSLTRVGHKEMPGFRTDARTLEDQASRYDLATGERVQTVSILRGLMQADFPELLAEAKGRHRDVLHTNSLEVLDGRAARRDPAFAAGNLLLSSRTMSMLSILDPRSGRIVWARKGIWAHQHDAKIVDRDSLMIFDNQGPGDTSRVLVMDPADLSVRWEHGPADGDGAFWSKSCSTAERLANGNTLVVASNPGYAFEVTPQGERVWEFHNPHRTGKDDTLVAQLFDVIRLPPADQLGWLEDAP